MSLTSAARAWLPKGVSPHAVHDTTAMRLLQGLS